MAVSRRHALERLLAQTVLTVVADAGSAALMIKRGQPAKSLESSGPTPPS
jgi:hypothetical protein